MVLQKFLCFDLRIGVLSASLFHLFFACIATVFNFILSLYVADPDMAIQQTLSFGVNLVTVIILVCLAYGAYKEARGFLLPFLIIYAFFIVIILLACVVLLFFDPLSTLLLILVLGIVLSFDNYLWYATLSLYQMLDPHNPNYVPQQVPSTVVYVEEEKPPQYYENNVADV